MPNSRLDLAPLIGDLVFERKRLSDALKRMEAQVSAEPSSGAITSGVGHAKLYSEFVTASISSERIDSIGKLLLESILEEQMFPANIVLQQVERQIADSAVVTGRAVVIERRESEALINKKISEPFSSILREMITVFVEYCIETPKERVVREKKEKATVQVECKVQDQSVKMMVVCDGNGLLPPRTQEFGRKLAAIGISAHFEGKPGRWSAWVFHLPLHNDYFVANAYVVGETYFCLPALSVLSCVPLSASEFNGELWTLDEKLDRKQIGDASGSKMVIEVAAGTEKASIVVDRAIGQEEIFLKPLQSILNQESKFLGAALTSNVPTQLALVMSPAYLVYGKTSQQHKKQVERHAV